MIIEIPAMMVVVSMVPKPLPSWNMTTSVTPTKAVNTPKIFLKFKCSFKKQTDKQYTKSGEEFEIATPAATLTSARAAYQKKSDTR